MSTPILATKLYIPPPPLNLIPRPRLVQRLDEGVRAGHRLLLISAPAGFGKSTLLSEWVHHTPLAVAWLSLDKSDDNPARFWAYFIAAFQTVHKGIASISPAALSPPDVVNAALPREAFLAYLINEIATISAPIAFVLDDFHVITDRQINDGVAFLLEHTPPKLHLIISSRADPSWPLARLRARGEMTELRVNDLRFSPAEAAAFLNHVMELELLPEDAAALEKRTEGWIAGLQMAAISMQGQRRALGVHDVSGFVAAFTGSNRFVLDYLVEEVLDQQSPAIQEFLLQTCILDRLTASLCEAVVRDPCSVGSPIEGLHGQGTLEYFERTNLFVVALDDRRQWYRYHHLFADLLHSRLKQSYPERMPALHRRASTWYEENGLLADAVSHALAAGDVERMARLVEGHVFSIMDHGELVSLERWLDALTEKEVRSRPWLCVFHAWVLVHTGQLDAVESRLRDAESAPSGPGQDGQSDGRRIAGHIAAIRAYAAVFRGKKDQAIELAHEALERLPEEEPVVRGYVTVLLGTLLRWSGDLTTAAQVTAEAIATSRAAGDARVAVGALCDLALSQLFSGQLYKAANTCRSALQLADEYVRRDGRRLPVAGLAHVRLSTVLREWNDLDAAIGHARVGVELCEQWEQTSSLIASLVNLATTLQASGDAGGALDAIRKAGRIATDLPPRFASYTQVYEARVRLAQGDLTSASRWAAAWERDMDGELDFQYEPGYLTLARVLIAQGERRPGGSLDRASSLLARLLLKTEAAGRVGRRIEILTLQALILQAQGQEDQALSRLERALVIAEPEGYVCTFVDGGKPMHKLLRQAVAQGSGDHARKLLAAFDTPTSPHPQTPKPPPPLLSERELQVLRLLTTNLSTPEIAAELFVAASTVRSHVKSIYRKLNVRRRLDAIRRAEELNLV